MTIDPEAYKWIAGAFAAVGAFMLKHLHGKINESANKADLAEALRVVASQRLEDLQRSEIYRRERREVEDKIFDILRKQDDTLSRIDERTAKLCK